MKDVAVVYDYFQVTGGAENLTLALCKEKAEMDLITAFINQKAFSRLPLDQSRITSLMSPTYKPGWQTLKSAWAFERRARIVDRYKTVIFSGSVAPLAIKFSRAQRNIYYCHTPPRFAYDLYDHYLDACTVTQRPVFRALVSYLRPRYEKSIWKMDKIYSNSKNVQLRLRRYLGLDSEVLYPPLMSDNFRWMSDGDYFLSTGRLEPLKRVDVIVRAFKEMPDQELVVASGGSELTALKRLARGSSNITFTGWVSQEAMAGLVGNCKATVYVPKDEDFGMSPVESMAAGKPVIAVDEGGPSETVLNGATGILIPADRVTPEGVVSAVRALLSSDALVRVRRPEFCERTPTEFAKVLLSS